MNCNNLVCRCGASDWSLSWSFIEEWELHLICNRCGAVHTLARSDDYNARVTDLISKEVISHDEK